MHTSIHVRTHKSNAREVRITSMHGRDGEAYQEGGDADELELGAGHGVLHAVPVCCSSET